MILSTLLRPPGAPAGKKATDAPPGGLHVLPDSRQRARRYDRALAVGVILSVLIHVLIVWLSPLVIRYMEEGTGVLPTPLPVLVPSEGMQALIIRVTEAPALEPEPRREPQPEPRRVTREPTAGRGLSAAERLRPRVGDWRLWVVPPLIRRPDATPAERAAEVRARLYAAIEANNDSLAAELAREAEALDWTVGEEGKKWGVSPGKIHLGGVTLPLPFIFAPHPATARQGEDRIGDYEAIQRQAGQADVDEAIEARIKAIREREEAARKAEAEKDTTSAGGG